MALRIYEVTIQMVAATSGFARRVQRWLSQERDRLDRIVATLYRLIHRPR